MKRDWIKLVFIIGKTHENFKDLHKRAASNNLLHSKAFKIAKNAKYEWISMHNCFIGL